MLWERAMRFDVDALRMASDRQRAWLVVNSWLSRAAAGDRPDEAEKRDEAVALVVLAARLRQDEEPIEEGSRQLLRLDGRHEAGAGDLPERRRRELVAPPSSPACDRARRHRDDGRKTLEAG